MRMTLKSIQVASVLSILLALSIDNCNGQCSGSSLSLTADDTYQSITSPNYPSSYPNNQNCEWTITASTLPYVLIFVEYKNLETRYDYLTVFSGSTSTLYYSENYNNPAVLVSSTNFVTISFTSDYSITYGGFLISYMEVDTVDACYSSLAATSTPRRLVYYYRRDYSITSCYFTITSSALVKITLDLVSGSVGYDDGTLQTVSTVGSIAVTSSPVTIYGYYGSDFVITYEEIASGTGSIVSTTASPYNYYYCIGNSFYGYRPTINADSSIQYFSSENYPGPYLSQTDCGILLEATNTSKSIRLNFTDVDLSDSDNVWVYDGPTTSFNQYSLFSTGISFLSSGYRVLIHFSSNYYGQSRGFQLSFTTDDRVNPAVTYSFTDTYSAISSYQTFSTPNYPNEYENYLDLYWLITKPNQDDTITLDFVVLDVELNDGCTYDSVSVYDGYLVSDPLLATFCGYDPVTFQDDSGLYILIRFQTDGSVTKKGFQLRFKIGTFEDPDGETDEAAGIPDYVYPIIAIAVFLLLAAVIFICVVNRHKRRIAAGKEMPAKPKLKKRTTQQLLDELNGRYGAKMEERKLKQSKKYGGYHPQPQTTGPNVNIIHLGGTSPHPPPSHDPVYPPPYIGAGTEMPQGNLAPVVTNYSQQNPSAPVEPMTNDGILPGPFNYISPSEARANEANAYNA